MSVIFSLKLTYSQSTYFKKLKFQKSCYFFLKNSFLNANVYYLPRLSLSSKCRINNPKMSLEECKFNDMNFRETSN